MSENEKPASKLPSIVGLVIALLVSAGLATAFLTDLPTRVGLVSSEASSDGHEDHDHGDHSDHAGHDHDDHAGHDHDQAADDDHAGHDHGEQEHSDHDHSDHDHGDHDHGDHGAEVVEASMPPFMADDLSVSSTVSAETDDHAGHDHAADGHEGHSDETSISLSPQARKNLKLTVASVSLGTFTRYIDVPAVVTDWPGRTHIDVTSPLTGVINSIKVSQGELVKNSTALFSLRLTHQDLVQTQEQFLAQLGQRDVEEREIQRLTSMASSGAVAGKTLINRKYERDMLLATIRAARQSLLLHGLTEDQINRIERDRELIREVTVSAPELHADDSLHHDSQHGHAWQPAGKASSVKLATHNHDGGHDHGEVAASSPEDDLPHRHVEVEFLVTSMDVNRGQSVVAGERLTQLSDYSSVLVEGQAFQRDSEVLRRAARDKLPLQAVFESTHSKAEVIDGLQVVNIGNEINRQSRALPFYVSLDNAVERSERRGDKHFASWKYKPGQRLKLRIPTSRLEDVFLVPADAVAEEGPERYVFVENGDHFDRVSVHAVAEDSLSVAIANDGQVRPGQTIAISAAHKLQMAIKNKSGGAIDPHAGHSH